MGKARPQSTTPTQREYLTQLFNAGLKLIPLLPHSKTTQEADWNKRGESDVAAYLKRAAPQWSMGVEELTLAVDTSIENWYTSGCNHGVLNEPSRVVVLDMDDPMAAAALEAGLRHIGSSMTVADLADHTQFKWHSPRGLKMMFRRPSNMLGATWRITRRTADPTGRVCVQTVIEFRGTGQDVLPFSHRQDKQFVLKWATPNGMLPPDARLAEMPMPLAEMLAKLARHDSTLITVMQQAAGTDPKLTGMDGVGDHDYPSRLAACVRDRAAVNAKLSVPDLLTKHGYTKRGIRWSAPGTTHAAGIAPSKTDANVWVCYHESDPLSGRIDAWRAFVELDHGGDLEAAKSDAAQYSALRLVERPAAQEKGPGPQEPGPSTPTEKETTGKDRNNLADARSVDHSTLHGRTLADLSSVPVREEVMVEGVALSGSLIYLGGSWSAGKTAMAIELACSIASGRGKMLGKRCVTGTVIYFCVEDATTVYRRARAWHMHHNPPGWRGQNLLFYSTLDLRDEEDTETALAKVREDIATLGIDQPVLMIIDTQAAATPGMEENSAADAGEVLNRINRVRDFMQCAVALVHHHGKDAEKGLRGSSVMSAAADTIVTFDLDDSTVPAVQTATVTKSRGMQRLREPLMSQVRVIDLGVRNNFGEPVTAMILVPLEGSTKEAKDAADWEKSSAKGLHANHKWVAERLELIAPNYPDGVPVLVLAEAVGKAKNLRPARAIDVTNRAVDACIKSGRMKWVDAVARTVRSGRPSASLPKF